MFKFSVWGVTADEIPAITSPNLYELLHPSELHLLQKYIMAGILRDLNFMV